MKIAAQLVKLRRRQSKYKKLKNTVYLDTQINAIYR